jgi:hypothetical protein
MPKEVRTLAVAWAAYRQMLDAELPPEAIEICQSVYYGGAAAVLGLVDEGFRRMDAGWANDRLEAWREEIRHLAEKHVRGGGQ